MDVYLPDETMNIRMSKMFGKDGLLEKLRILDDELKSIGQPMYDVTVLWSLGWRERYREEFKGFLNEIGNCAVGVGFVYKDIRWRHLVFILKFKNGQNIPHGK